MYDVYKTPVCPYCGGTGTVTLEYQQGENMVQRDEKCSCQVEGTDEYNERIDHEKHLEAGLAYVGKNLDGDKEWIGTKEQWTKYEK